MPCGGRLAVPEQELQGCFELLTRPRWADIAFSDFIDESAAEQVAAEDAANEVANAGLVAKGVAESDAVNEVAKEIVAVEEVDKAKAANEVATEVEAVNLIGAFLPAKGLDPELEKKPKTTPPSGVTEKGWCTAALNRGPAHWGMVLGGVLMLIPPPLLLPSMAGRLPLVQLPRMLPELHPTMMLPQR